MSRVSVLLPHRLGLLTYAAEAPLAPGAVVTVPLAGRSMVGVVWDDPPDDTVDAARLKPVRGLASDVALPDDLRTFVDFFSHYTLTPRGAALRLVLRSGEGLAPPRIERHIAASGTAPTRLTEARKKVLDALATGPLPRPLLTVRAGVSPGTVAGLLKSGVLVEVDAAGPTPRPPLVPTLSAPQADAAAALRHAVDAHTFETLLLEGVTGSGKTEVFFEAIDAAVAAGRQALVLMPEIALTPMVTTRLAERFGVRPGEWHSQRPQGARARLWRAVADGTEQVVVGARSALFLPFRDLGLVVVDEEHDSSFKQEDGIIYHGRDMAIARAKAAGVPVILSSATPSLETRLHADSGRYRRIALPGRHGGAAMPQIEVVDLRADPPEHGQWLAPTVRHAVTQTLNAGDQALLFLNRRGYAPLTICRACGHRLNCPHCSTSLVDHRLRGRLMCHHCGYEARRPTECPECHKEDTLVACGPGVERVAEEAVATWPQARTVVISSDMAGGPATLAEALDTVANGDADLIVGTQLVAKGYTFPKLQLAVVVDADVGLHNGDPRAAERTFQLLTQVAGRAGRVVSGGRALLQTHAPEHPAIAAMAAGDTEAFYAAEAAARYEGGLPPYRRLAAIIVSATDRSEAYGHAAALARTAPGDPLEVLGPAEAPLARIRGRYRFRLLVSAPRTAPLQERVAQWLAAVPLGGSLRRAVDIDPQSFL